MKPLDPRLLRYARSTRGFIVLAVVLGVLTAILVIAQARLLSDAIVKVTAGGETTTYPVEDEADVVARYVASRCFELASQRVATLSFSDEVATRQEGDVEVGTHIGPPHELVPGLLGHFQWRYESADFSRIQRIIVAETTALAGATTAGGAVTPTGCPSGNPTGVTAGLATGEWTPLPAEIYPITEARAAFRRMQQARHIGKIVVQIPNPLQPRADRSYASRPTPSPGSRATSRDTAGSAVKKDRSV